MSQSQLRKCSYCQTEVTSQQQLVFCSKCHRPHHEDCWRENRKCSIFGCGSRNYERHRRHVQGTAAGAAPRNRRPHLDLGGGGTSRSPGRSGSSRGYDNSLVPDSWRTPPRTGGTSSSPPRRVGLEPPNPPGRGGTVPPSPAEPYYPVREQNTGPCAGSQSGDDPCSSICSCIIMANLVGFCLGAPLPLCTGGC